MNQVTIAWSPSAFGVADDAPLRLLERLGVTVRPNPFGRRLTEPEAIEHLKGVDGLIAGLEPLTAAVLASTDQLRAIARVGIGIDNVDLEAAAARGIPVSNTPEAPSAAVAELTVTAALTLTRDIGAASAQMHEGVWEKRLAPGLSGTCVLLVGFGRIGQAVAERLKPFGPVLLAVDPGVEGAGSDLVEFVSLEEGLARADVVSLHAGGREQLLGAAEFGLVRDGTILLNSARAELVDESALVEALSAGRIGKVWFDVFWEEPYSGPLIGMENVLLTPHIGTYTSACRRSMEMQATRNLLADLGISADEAL